MKGCASCLVKTLLLGVIGCIGMFALFAWASHRGKKLIEEQERGLTVEQKAERRAERHRQFDLEVKNNRAVTEAEKHVRSLLVSPSTAKFESLRIDEILSGKRFVVTGHVDSQNVFSAMIRQSYAVELDAVSLEVTNTFLDGKKR